MARDPHANGLTGSEQATYQALVARGVKPEDAREDALDGVHVDDARGHRRAARGAGADLAKKYREIDIHLDSGVHSREEMEKMLGFLEGRGFTVAEQQVSQAEIDAAVASIRKEMD